MNEQEAITRAEAWYLQRYHAVAHGHLPVDRDGQAFREDGLLCIDLVPELEAEVIKVLLDLTGEDVAVLDEGRPCPSCASSKAAEQKHGLHIRRHSWLKGWGKRRRPYA